MSNIIKFTRIHKGGGRAVGQNINYYKYNINNSGIYNRYLNSSITLKSLKPQVALESYERRFYSSDNKPSISSSAKRLNFKEIVVNLKKSPSSHLISFLTLHELTALLPVIILFLILNQIEYEVNLDSEYLEKGKKFANYFIKKLGLEESENVLKYTVNLTASYGLVKLALPLRLAACLALTPSFANRVVQPIINRVKNFKTK